jgi:branched-chain amino acid transport system substrate-binding protein
MYRISLLLIIAVMLLTACGGATTATVAPAATQVTAETQAPATSEPIRFGVIQPLTGAIAAAGSYVVSGVNLAVERINSEGGVCGRNLEPVVVDGKNDPQESANAAELLITRDKVPIIIGAWGSSATLAVMPVMERDKVPLLVETSSSSKITSPETPGYDWVHRISPPSAIEAEAAEPFLVKDLGMTKVAILSVNNDWGRGAAEVFTAAIERQGGKIVSSDFIDESATDVLPQLTSIKNSEADSILMTTDSAQIANILKQYKELGMTQTVLTTGGSNYPQAIISLSSPDVVNGTYHLAFWVPTRPDLAGDPELSKWYVQEYQKKDLPEVGLGESFRGFDAVLVVAKAIEDNNCSLDPASLNDALGKVEVNTLAGPVKFDLDNGHQSRPHVYILKVENGETTVPEFQFNK